VSQSSYNQKLNFDIVTLQKLKSSLFVNLLHVNEHELIAILNCQTWRKLYWYRGKI